MQKNAGYIYISVRNIRKIIYIYTLWPASPDRLPEISISKENLVFF